MGYLINLKTDIQAVKERDPAARNTWEVLTCYPGFKARRAHRRAHWLYKRGLKWMARMVSHINRFFTGIEIHPAATIGKGLFIDHGMGVVIGETAEIGDNVTIYQGATLGGTGKDSGKRHPTIEDDVVISSGAKVLGPFTVGKGSKIGAGAVVLKEVPPYCTVVGVPGKIVRRYCAKGLQLDDCSKCAQPCANPIEQGVNLDQVNLPDPVAAELATITERLQRLEEATKRPLDVAK